MPGDVLLLKTCSIDVDLKAGKEDKEGFVFRGLFFSPPDKHKGLVDESTKPQLCRSDNVISVFELFLDDFALNLCAEIPALLPLPCAIFKTDHLFSHHLLISQHSARKMIDK